MDLATRKHQFIEKFEKIKDINLIERFEVFLQNELQKIAVVAYTINGTPISKKEYIKRNTEAEVSFKNGNFKTKDELLKKYKKEV